MKTAQNGKGDKTRPMQIDWDEFDDNYNAIFRRNDKNVEKNRYKRTRKVEDAED